MPVLKRPAANWVKKGKVSTYGYKAHTMTDSNGIVVSMEVTSANVHDTVMFPDLIDKAQLSEGDTVYADKGYHSEQNREILERRNLIDRIMHKRKRNEPGTRQSSTATKASPGAAMQWRGPLVLSNGAMAGAGPVHRFAQNHFLAADEVPGLQYQTGHEIHFSKPGIGKIRPDSVNYA